MRLYERRTERDRFHPLKEISRREREKKKITALYNALYSSQTFVQIGNFRD